MKYKILFSFIVFNILILGGFYFDKSHRIQLFTQEHLNKINALYHIAYNQYKKNAEDIYLNHLDTPEIINIFESLNGTNENQMRQLLYKKLSPMYENIKVCCPGGISCSI